MKLKTIFISILATVCLGMTACTKDKQPKPSEETETSEPVESEEPTEETEEPTEETEEPSETEESTEPETEEPSESETEEPSESETEEPSETEPEVANDGSLEHPWTVSEGYAIATELEVGADAGVQYFTAGVVTGNVSWYNGRLSFDITDGEHTLYVYNMNNESNKASYKEDAIDIKDGDAIIVAGTFKNYNGKLEICYVKNVADCYRAG